MLQTTVYTKVKDAVDKNYSGKSLSSEQLTEIISESLLKCIQSSDFIEYIDQQLNKRAERKLRGN